MSSEDLQKALLCWSGGFSAIGGVGGNISFGEQCFYFPPKLSPYCMMG